MTRLFGRKLELFLFEEDGDAIDLGEMSVEFDIERFTGSTLNVGQFTIYNLSRSTSATLAKGGQHLEVRAGYGERFGVVFAGRVTTARTFQEGPDRITELYSFDGYRDYRNSVVNLSFPKGSTLRQVVAGVAGSFSEAQAPDLSVLEDQTLSGSRTISGKTADAMDQLARSYGFSWGIQNGNVEIVRRGKANGSTPVDVTVETGMIGSPTTREDQKVEVKMLMHPGVVPNGRIRIASAGAILQADPQLAAQIDANEVVQDVNEGEFRVLRVIHTGETRGAAWYTTIVGIRG